MKDKLDEAVRAPFCGRIVERGEIVERGTHAELLALGGRYKQLHDRQHGQEMDQSINPGEDFTTPAGAGGGR